MNIKPIADPYFSYRLRKHPGQKLSWSFLTNRKDLKARRVETVKRSLKEIGQNSSWATQVWRETGDPNNEAVTHLLFSFRAEPKLFAHQSCIVISIVLLF
jgi:hypothetical protein